MRRWRPGLALMFLPALAGAEETDKGYLQPSISVFGMSEHASGAAYLPPNDTPRKGLAAAAALGLDGRVRVPGGWMQVSGFALAHDPFSTRDRGLFAAGRVRGSAALGHDWHLRVDDSARLQRREAGALADFQRNEAILGLERVSGAGGAVGIRIGDRRRAVSGAPALGFDRQSIAVSTTWGRAGGSQWRLEAGPQHYSADTASGWRLAGTAEWAGRAARWHGAVRVTWLEPLERRGGGAFATDAMFAPTLPAAAPTSQVPAPAPSPAPAPAPVPTAAPPIPDTGQPESRMLLIPREPLLGPSLVVDPLEDDESDWDFGRRKQEIVAFVSRSFGRRLMLTAELRADIERGPDLLGLFAGDVRRERLAARAHVRHTLGTRWSVLAQAGWQRLDDNRPRLSYSRGLFSLGLELRP